MAQSLKRRVVSALLLIVLLVSGLPLVPSTVADEAPRTERWVVGFHDYPRGIERGDSWNGYTVVLTDPVLRFIVVEASGLGGQADDPDVRYVERDLPVELLFTPNDPRWSDQYGPERIRAPDGWSYTLGESERVLCVIDTGVRSTHEDLAGSRWLGGRNIPYNNNDARDIQGHGTHVNGIAAATTDNGKGIAGVGLVPYKHVKVMDENGYIFWSYVASGIRWCADNGGDVINLSLGGSAGSTAVQDAVRYADDEGLLIVAASGNSGCNSSTCILYPARYPEVVAVGCTTSSDGRCYFSSSGPQLELVAPGYDNLATCYNSDTSYCKKSGTSMASPHVAGAATLLWSYAPYLTNDELRTLLHDTARDLGPAGHDNEFGHGIVDLGAAFGALFPRFPLEPWYTTDFDNGAPEWTLDGLWHVAAACPDVHSPPNYLGYHSSGSCSLSGFSQGHAFVEVDLTTALQAELSFMHRWETRSSTDSVDQMVLSVSTDGGVNWDDVRAWDSRDANDDTWHELSVLLDRYVGETVRIRLTFDSVDTSTTTHKGWHIDDFTVFAIDNFPPVADAGADRLLRDSDGSGAEAVTLDGTSSTDPWDDGTIASYEWFWDETLIATGATPTVSIPEGEHVVTLRVTDDGGASAEDDVLIVVLPNAAPLAHAGPDQTVTDPDASGSEEVLLSGGGTDSDGSIVAYEWTHDGEWLGNGADLLVPLPVGAHLVTLTVTDDGGATANDTLTVVIDPNVPPVAEAGPDQNVSDGEGQGFTTVILDAIASTDADGDLVSFDWTLDEAVIASGATPHVDLPIGDHLIGLNVTDNGGASDRDTVRITVLPNQVPIADPGPDRVVGDHDDSGTATVTLDGTASSDIDGTIAGYEWSVDGAVIGNGSVVDVELPLGLYNISLEVTDNGGANDTRHQVIEVVENMPPVAEFVASCRILDCTFGAAPSVDPDGALVSFDWDFGDGNTSTTLEGSVAHTYGTQDNFTACLTVHDDGGKSDTYCAPVSPRRVLFLSDFSDGTAGWTLDGHWRVHDSTCTSPPTKPFYLGYHLAGSCSFYDGTWNSGNAVFPVDLEATAEPVLSFMQRWETYGGSSTIHRHYIQVRAIGTSSWSTIDSWDATTPDQVAWKNRQYDLSPWAGQQVEVRFRFDAAAYWSVNKNPGWHIDFVQVAASPQDLVPINWWPTASITGPSSVIDTRDQGHATVAFSGSGSVDPDGELTSWSWSLDGALVGNESNLTLDLPTGDHTIRLSVTDDGAATDWTTHRITILPNGPPVAVAGADQQVGDVDGSGAVQVALDGSGSHDDGVLLDHSWYEGGALLASGAQVGVDLPVGTHNITLIVTDDGDATGNDTLQIIVAPNEPPSAEAGADQLLRDTDGTDEEMLLLDGRVSADPDGSIVTYDWYRGATFLGSGALLSAPVPVGTHIVSLIVYDEAGATDADSFEVAVLPNEPPVAVAPADMERNDDDRLGYVPLFFDGSASQDPDDAIVAYEWSIDGSLVATGVAPRVDVPVGDHEVVLVVRDAANATGSDTFRVVVTDNRRPTAEFSFECSDVLCAFNGSASSDPDGDVLLFQWSFGDGKTGDKATLHHAYPHAGSYVACLTIDDRRGFTDSTCAVVHLFDVQYEEDFDRGVAPGWALDGLWRLDDFCVVPYAGSHYLGYHQGLMCNYQTIGRTTGAASYKLDLRQATEADLFFETRWQVESTSGSEARDYMRIQVKPDNDPGIYTLRNWDSRTGNRLAWTEETIDLDRFTGDRVTIMFSFDSVNVLHNHHRGWYVDDIRVISDAPRPNQAPSAAFTNGCSGLDCHFDGIASTDDRYVVDWSWSLGDGNTATGAAVDHVYEEAGTYDVTLTVTDNSGATDTVTRSVVVEVAPLEPPIAEFTYTCSSRDCSLDGAPSTDPDGQIVSWSWDLGNGTVLHGEQVDHTFDDAGEHNVTLHVTDDDGLEDMRTRTITIGAPAPPEARFTHGCETTDCTFDATASLDPDGRIVSWSWDLGDGSTASGEVVTHAYAAGGDYTVALTVTDDEGLDDTVTTVLTVYESDPGPRPAPDTPPHDPHVPDEIGDVLGDTVPVSWMDIESSWFEHDPFRLYAGMKLADIPQNARSTAYVAYRVSFTPTWDLTDPTLGGRIEAGATVREFEVHALLSPGPPPTPIETQFRLFASVRPPGSASAQEVFLADITGELSVDSDIIWWPIERALLGAPAGATLTMPHALSAPEREEGPSVSFGDRTGTGSDHTF